MRINKSSLAATVSTAIVSYVVAVLAAGSQPISVAIALVVFCGLVVYFILEVLPMILLRLVPALQRFGTFGSRIDGIWIQRFERNEDRIYSYATIKYNPLEDCIIYSGCAYDNAGNIKGEWSSRNVIPDETKREFFYSYEGEVYDSPHPSTLGIGTVRFAPAKWGLHSIGTGSFMESASQFTKHFFKTDRLTRALSLKLIRKPTPLTNDDIRDLIRAYHNLHLKDSFSEVPGAPKP